MTFVGIWGGGGSKPHPPGSNSGSPGSFWFSRTGVTGVEDENDEKRILMMLPMMAMKQFQKWNIGSSNLFCSFFEGLYYFCQIVGNQLHFLLMPGLFLKHLGAIFVGDHKAFSFEVLRQFGCQDCLGTGCFFTGPPPP